MDKIINIAKKLGLDENDIELYGQYKAKINNSFDKSKNGKVILVTATSPTPYGEGKTTTSIGIADAFSKLGDSVCLALREPSLGPVFGTKGGATGGGQSQLYPSVDINLHFNGDMHAITSANNLIASVVDNHIYQGNALNIDQVYWKRCLDVNDRALRPDFTITAASEMMATFCLAADLKDLKNRIREIVIGKSVDGTLVKVKDLECVDAVTILLKDAIKPNLVQTLEGTPAIVHGGPFANIALGCNSVIATRVAQSLADYVVTEAGFGSDLGAEKFIDIKARLNHIDIAAVVLVSTVRSIKYNSGTENLLRHVDNLKSIFNLNVVVAINRFITDTDADINIIKDSLDKINCKYAVNESFALGGVGSVDLVKEIKNAIDPLKKQTYTYELDDEIETKIQKLVTRVYRADGVKYSEEAKSFIKDMTEEMKLWPICVAKTQYSFSDNPKLLGAAHGYDIHVRDIKANSGARMLVIICGDVMLMPGLSADPKYRHMHIGDNGEVSGVE